MVYNIDTTTFLLERLKSDKNLRRICGWECVAQIPSEATFSRAFTDFAKTQLPQRAHKALIEKTLADEVILHNSRDSTAIEAREKPQRKIVDESTKKKVPRKKGRPRKSEENSEREEPELTRVQKQKTMTLEEMLNDLPTACDKGAKKDSKGNTMYWIGYKLHLDTIDGGIPVSALVTSASLNDSQVAIPLATITRERIVNCYDLMDAAYDVPAIIEHSQSLGHIPLVDKNPRRNKELKKILEEEGLARKTLNLVFPETLRYNRPLVQPRVRRFSGLFWPIFDFFSRGHIRMLILPRKKKSKSGSKEPENRQNLGCTRGLMPGPLQSEPIPASKTSLALAKSEYADTPKWHAIFYLVY